MILQQLKNTWGCCFHKLVSQLNFKYGGLQRFTVKHSNNYWRECGIQPPEKCHYDIRVKALIQLNVQAGSNMDAFLVNTYACTPLTQYFTEASSCATFLYDRLISSKFCALKHHGKYCLELLQYSNRTDNLFSQAYHKCFITRSICTSDCKTTLQSLLDHAGCCLHLINDTESFSRYTTDILRYSLWNSCGIEPPSQCSSATQCRGFAVVSSIAVLIFLCFFF